MNPPHRPQAAQPVALPPRPQVGIERLPTRHMATEPRESMNCKSCRKRKIKCNRLRPACEACLVFQCPCIYDAVPKKRGPKTDVLEALLKRVDGLEAKLKEKDTDGGQPSSSSSIPTAQEPTAPESASSLNSDSAELEMSGPAAKRIATEDRASPPGVRELPVYSPRVPVMRSPSAPPVHTDTLLDTYFTRFHTKPYHILDESSIRNRIHLNQLPTYLFDAIASVAARLTPHPNGYQAAARLSEEYAARARTAVDIDEPSIDALQALLLLVTAYTAAGKGKKAYMLMTNAVGMIMALEFHREMDAQARVTPVERETRRRLFWSCYLLDRYVASGSKRPSLISDHCIVLRLPSWTSHLSTTPIDGELFLCGSNLQYFQGSGKRSQGSSGMIIDITRVLGITNRYLAAGGVKGDSHFPWHSLSNLSKIRQELDVWASGADIIFSSMDTLFGQVDSTILVLCKLIYHLIHCLIYRPFLPISLAELAGNGQHQSWQIEATNMCFFHANAIADLVEVGRQSNAIKWPSFVGYCICTAGSVHIHGAYYGKPEVTGEMNFFSSSAEFLSREMQLLSQLRYQWAIVQHQRDMLQRLYDAHGELVKTLTGNAMRYVPGFQLEDFFDRYSNIGGSGGRSFHFDTANLSLADETVDFSAESSPMQTLWGPEGTGRPNLKRKSTEQPMPGAKPPPQAPTASTPTYPRQSIPIQPAIMPPRPSPVVNTMPPMLPAHMENQQQQQQQQQQQHHHQQRQQQHMGVMRATADVTAASYGIPHNPQTAPGSMPPLTGVTYSPTYNYNLPPAVAGHGQPVINEATGGYDAMFGGIPTNAYGSPAGWQGDGHRHIVSQTTPGAAAPSPSTKSNTGSTGTTGDEKDPFMSLLEQLANDEQRQNNGLKNELDFFLASAGGNS